MFGLGVIAPKRSNKALLLHQKTNLGENTLKIHFFFFWNRFF